MTFEDAIPFVFTFLIGSFLSAFILWSLHRAKVGTYQTLGKSILLQAEADAAKIRQNGELSLKQAQIEMQRELEQRLQGDRRKLLVEEERLKLRDDKIETRILQVDKKLADLDKREGSLIAQRSQLDTEKTQ